MAHKIRKQIYLESDQAARLKHVSQETGLSEAELIRQALDQQISRAVVSRRDPGAWQRERAFIEHLIELGPVQGGRTWRREELHDR